MRFYLRVGLHLGGYGIRWGSSSLGPGFLFLTCSYISEHKVGIYYTVCAQQSRLHGAGVWLKARWQRYVVVVYSAATWLECGGLWRSIRSAARSGGLLIHFVRQVATDFQSGALARTTTVLL